MPYLFDTSTGEYLTLEGTTGKDVSLTTDDKPMSKEFNARSSIRFDTPLQRAHNFKFEDAYARMMANPNLAIHYPHGR